MEKDPIKVVKYILYKCTFYGDLITNLKMQKILYYVYVWNLVKNGNPCFKHKFQAWPNGPVYPIVYKKLSKYKASPISEDFLEFKNEKDFEDLKRELGSDFIKIVDKIYELYGTKSAFELVNLTHSEAPWKNAIKSTETYKEISDKDILVTYGKKR